MIPEIPIGFFLEKILPPLAPSLLDKIDYIETTDDMDTLDVIFAGYALKGDELAPLIPPMTHSSRNTSHSTGVNVSADGGSGRSLSSPGFEADVVESSCDVSHPRRASQWSVTARWKCDNVFHTIADVVKALWILHKAGWVQIHKGGDHHNVRMVNPCLLAAEILAQKYLFEKDSMSLSTWALVLISTDPGRTA
ncbi:hypothetical protein FB446DRAFT_790652 [Lentinula raphanica]|nr:hypothetical protein FB446DRAFT_790652 [Lentinula raphanica]